MIGGDEMLVLARSALLDAVEALEAHLDSIVLVGAQAVYLHTGSAEVALAESTKDSDFSIDVRGLGASPLIEEALRTRGFYLLDGSQPGAWMTASGIPVDFMVPDGIVTGSSRRSVAMPPHDKHVARRTPGLEAALIDNDWMDVPSLALSDDRSLRIRVAGPAALLVAKLHKLGERATAASLRPGAPSRLSAKDAHDIYRILYAVDTADLVATMDRLLAEEVSRPSTETAVAYLRELFAAGPQAIGAHLAGEAEREVGVPETVSATVVVLAGDLLDRLPTPSSN